MEDRGRAKRARRFWCVYILYRERDIYIECVQIHILWLCVYIYIERDTNMVLGFGAA